ncbi:MAG: hypothetical protein WCH98_12080, partial [Verrucomicrobiota bacterium]
MILPKSFSTATLALLLAGLCAQAEPEIHEIGGPLAGVKLAGPYSKVGYEVSLYPDSVEVFSAPHGGVRSFFDRQSLLKNWIAPNIPGSNLPNAEVFTPANVRRWREKDITVFPCKVNAPVFQLDLGKLKPGLYAIRVIAAVAPDKIHPFLDPLFLKMRVNDGLKGEISDSRVRIGYRDDFFSVAELYFHVTEEREMKAEVSVDEGSKVDLLVHNITLDNVLAGFDQRPIKTRMTIFGPGDISLAREGINEDDRKLFSKRKPLSAEERLARDEIIWNGMPPLNAQCLETSSGVAPKTVTSGAEGQTREQIEEKWGKWESRNTDIYSNWDLWSKGVLIFNRKLGLTYTMDDLKAGKPLPAPYPFQVDCAGLFARDPADPGKGQFWSPIAEEVTWRWRDYSGNAGSAARNYWKSGDADFARDGAIALIRWAYDWPSLDASNALSCVTRIPGFLDRDTRFQGRITAANFLAHYANYLHGIEFYDMLFDYIKGNEELAQSVHRFIPWINTSQDVIGMLDSYLVQHTARRSLRGHDITMSSGIAECASALGDPSFTDPWMDWLMATGFESNLSSSCDREGTKYLGSTYYCQEDDGAAQRVADIQRYLNAGGSQKYNLANPSLYPKPLAQCRWQLGLMIAGLEFPRIGDVSGPDKRPGFTLPALKTASLNGWKWSGDPRFAWLIKNLCGRQGQSDAEWAKIEAAAAGLKRAPWLDNRSRVLANWCGILESGLSHDDARFRRALYVRAGLGEGHSHIDTLDLQLVAHGLPMTVDGGQRSGYSKPNDRVFSRTHNTVEVDGKSYGGYSWVQALSDAEGARYMRVEAAPPPDTRLFRRQVALIDVDEGAGSQPLTAEQQKFDTKLPAGITTPNSYALDVFRVAGGRQHTYCFHAMVNDSFETNAKKPKRVDAAKTTPTPKNEAEYLAIFESSPESRTAGDSPEVLEATWRYSRDGKIGSEPYMAGP